MNCNGYLKLIIGPMYAGKSTELLRNIDKFNYLKKNILVINHKSNNRYGTNNLSTHSGEIYNNCINVTALEEVLDDYIEEFTKADVIIIDELQFFKDALKYVTEWCDVKKKYIVASGLSGNFERKPIGQVLEIIPYADETQILKALCSKCCDGTPAIFSKAIRRCDSDPGVGGSETYIAVCRHHYLNNN
jgi:thymidine kinase